MSKLVKKYTSNKIECTIWENEFDGKKNYQFKFQKSYIGQDKQWKNTEYFSITDLNDVLNISNMLLNKNIKERQLSQSQASGLQNQQYQQKPNPAKKFLDEKKQDLIDENPPTFDNIDDLDVPF